MKHTQLIQQLKQEFKEKQTPENKYITICTKKFEDKKFSIIKGYCIAQKGNWFYLRDVEIIHEDGKTEKSQYAMVNNSLIAFVLW